MNKKILNKDINNKIKHFKTLNLFISIKTKILNKHKENCLLVIWWIKKQYKWRNILGMIKITKSDNLIMIKVHKEEWTNQCHLQIYQIKNIVIQEDLKYQTPFSKYGELQTEDFNQT